MVNEDFDPSDKCEEVLAILEEEHRANPRRIIDMTGIQRENVEYFLRRLYDAGWIKKPARGLYEYNKDPRKDE